MNKDSSIRKRLLLWGAIGSSTLCILLLISVYFKSLHEAAELLDGELVAAARIAAQTLPVSADGAPISTQALTLEQHAYEAPLIVEAWSSDGKLLFRIGARVAVPPPTQVGFFDLMHEGQAWRSYVLKRQAGTLIRVMASADALDAIATDIASTLAIPWLVGVPIAIGLLCWIVTAALRPLGRLSQVIQSQKVDSLSELETKEWPLEVKPLISAINSLIGRLRDLRRRERDLVADAAHELRTPLTGIKLHADVALGEKDPKLLQSALAQIQQGSVRLATLVTQLLDLARLDSTHEILATEVNIGELVRRVIANLLPVADRHKVMVVAGDNIDAIVHGDAALIETMLANLVANAIAHSPQNAVVEVEGGRLGDGFTLRIADAGPGIPVGDRDRVFERFARLSNSKPGGTGLGLAIVKRVADLHSAQVEIADSNGAGCVIAVHFRRN